MNKLTTHSNERDMRLVRMFHISFKRLVDTQVEGESSRVLFLVLGLTLLFVVVSLGLMIYYLCFEGFPLYFELHYSEALRFVSCFRFKSCFLPNFF